MAEQNATVRAGESSSTHWHWLMGEPCSIVMLNDFFLICLTEQSMKDIANNQQIVCESIVGTEGGYPQEQL